MVMTTNGSSINAEVDHGTTDKTTVAQQGPFAVMAPKRATNVKSLGRKGK